MQRTPNSSGSRDGRARHRHINSNTSSSRSHSFSSHESLDSLIASEKRASPTRRVSRPGTRRGVVSVPSGDQTVMRHSFLKVREEARRKQKKRECRLKVCLTVYISCVTVYLMVALRRLHEGDMSDMTTTTMSAHQNGSERDRQPSSSSSFFLSKHAAMLSDWLLKKKRSRKVGGAVTSSVFESNNLYPPPFPIQTRDQSIQLSADALKMCTRTLWHTVETTTIVLPDSDTFIHTGDIDDLWLRDSAAQVHPLLIPAFWDEKGVLEKEGEAVGDSPRRRSLIELDPKLNRIVSGLIKRTSMYIRHDPYANAFRIDDSYVFNEEQKRMGRHDLISTWNYELDSACYYMRLLYFYWKQSPNSDNIDSVLRLKSVEEAVEIMVDLWIAEQRHEDDHYPIGKLLDCQNCNKPYRYPGLPRDGKGSRTNSTAGMTWSGFRPSDDICMYGYLVPANMFAVVVLGYMVEMAEKLWQNSILAMKAQRLAAEIDQGIKDHAIVYHTEFGRIYAYEVDGLGSFNLMDDANIPSLLSIPYLGYKYDPEVYQNTRRFIFSPANPEYRKGSNALTGEIEGYGSPHMEQAIHDNIWPMSIAMRALTSDNVQEKIRLVEQLVKASAGTLWMHESFDVTNPLRFTRSWFCWSDSLFAELVMSLTDSCPQPDYKYHVLEWRDPVRVPGGRFSLE